jgi:hypothetical protein
MDVDHYTPEHKYVLNLDIGLTIVIPNLTTFDMFILSIHPILMLAILSLVGIVENRDIQKEIVGKNKNKPRKTKTLCLC